MPTAEDFRDQLTTGFTNATRAGRDHVRVRSGDLHERLGGYPGSDHRMPVCCEVMYGELRDGDEVLRRPPKGKGANLVIRYWLPR